MASTVPIAFPGERVFSAVKGGSFKAGWVTPRVGRLPSAGGVFPGD